MEPDSDSPVKPAVDYVEGRPHDPELLQAGPDFHVSVHRPVFSNTCHLVVKTRFDCRCNNISDNDVPTLPDIHNKANIPFGLCDVHLATFSDFPLDKDRVAINPLTQGLFHVNEPLDNGPCLEKFKKLPLPR